MVSKAQTTGLSKEQLQSLVNDLAWNQGYDCYTRAGFEKLIWPQIKAKARWMIFFDIDDMHGLNEQHGYDGVNELIKKSLAMRASDYMAGQWFSGDEFVLCITTNSHRREDANPIEFALRLAELFLANGISATFAIAPVTSDDLYTNVTPAHQSVQEAKQNGKRGTISLVPGEPR